MGKKQEEEFVQVKCQEYYKLENELRIKFTELLKKNGFLQKESCTNEEAFKRVSLLLDIINRFFVENVPSNYLNNRKDHFDFYKIWKKFNRDIVHIDKQLRVPNMVKYRDSDGDIRERKDYEVYAFEFDSIEGISRRTLNAYNEFSPIYSRLAKKEAILGQGIQGEERLYNRLRIIGDKIRIIQNIICYRGRNRKINRPCIRSIKNITKRRTSRNRRQSSLHITRQRSRMGSIRRRRNILCKRKSSR